MSLVALDAKGHLQMKSKLQNRKQNGFTIIEVLIVLAIAGLIMLIVFLAVPALQRNQRNNARKNDASRIAAAIREYWTNHNNTPPSSLSVPEILSSAGTLSIYTEADELRIDNATIAGGPPFNTSPIYVTDGTDSLHIILGAECTSDRQYPGGIITQHATTPGRRNDIPATSVAIKYALESTGSPISVCQDI